MKKSLLIALMTVLSIPTMYAQTYEWERPLQSGEKEIDFISDEVQAGEICRITNGTSRYAETNTPVLDRRTTKTKEELYQKLLSRARARCGSNAILRNFRSTIEERPFTYSGKPSYEEIKLRYYKYSASVVVKDEPKTTRQNNNDEEEDDLSRALNKALQDVREGSRIAIDQIKVTTGMNREEYKDNVVELLLDKGFKVVAKEYLEKLYEEQKDQQSGIYNERTTVKSNNFSAVGYFLNVRLTETTLRVQVVNVSTGEYESNVTIKL